MIKVRHLKKVFRTPDGQGLTVLKDINCDIEKGEVVSIIGPSGTGKSTLLRCLNRLEKPTSGVIEVEKSVSLCILVTANWSPWSFRR